MDTKKKKPSRVQGAWGGGGASGASGAGARGASGAGAQQPRKVGTIGQRRMAEKFACPNPSQRNPVISTLTAASVASSSSSEGESGRVTGESGRVTGESGRATGESGRATGERGRVTGESGRATGERGRATGESRFVFQQPTDEDLFRKPPEEMVILEGGLREISAGPTGSARLGFFPRLFDEKEADWIFDDLLNQLPWRQRSNRKDGRDEFVEPRLTAWFGDFPYRYSGVVQEPHPWSPIMTMLKDRIEQMTERRFNSCLANYYRNDKDSIGWHSDDEAVLGKLPFIASLSFGDVRVFELRKKPEPPDERDDYRFSQVVKIPLPHGSLLVMEGATQEDWQHRVPKEYHDRDSRINLTFRTIYPELDA